MKDAHSSDNRTITFFPIYRTAGITIYTEDVTERQELNDLVRRTEEQFRTLVNSVADGILVVDDLKRLITFTNPKAEEIFGYEPGELVNRPLALLIPDPLKTVHLNHHDAYAQNPSPRHMGTGLRIFGRRKDGREVPVDVSLSPVRTAQGTFTTAIVRDASVQRELERETVRVLELEREARELAEKSNRTKDEFLATLSHELRDPRRSHTGHRAHGLRGRGGRSPRAGGRISTPPLQAGGLARAGAGDP